MIVLSHRGCWKGAEEKNSLAAFRRSFSLGFGTETDFRDALGKLVVAHDPPGAGALPADDFFALYAELGQGLPLALNVKADGLQTLLKEALERFGIARYFVFDMSVPDALACVRQGLKIFTRQSELEPSPNLYQEAEGVWMDCFFSDWIQEKDFDAHLQAGKQVCLVSPELQRRPQGPFWERLRKSRVAQSDRLLLCTDFPEEARDFFHG